MEAQLHHTHGRHSDEPRLPADEHGEEKKSVIEKVKAKAKKLTDTIKQETVYEPPPVRCGLVQPTGDLGTPVLVEDLHATHSDIVDPPVRTFAQWEEEERHGEPPPLSTGFYGTDLSQVGHHGSGQDVNTEQSRGGIGKSTGMEEDPSAPNPMKAAPSSHQAKDTDPASTGGKAAGITEVLRSFDKMGVYDARQSESSKPDQHEQKVYTGSHDQFAPEPVENPPRDNVAGNPSSDSSSYTKKLSAATSAIADKAAAAKGVIASKLGYTGENRSEKSTGSRESAAKSAFPSEYAHKVADTVRGTLAPVYEKVVGSGSSVMSKRQGSENPVTTEIPERKGASVKEYLVETLRPGEEHKALSEVITHAFHRGKDGEREKKSGHDDRRRESEEGVVGTWSAGEGKAPQETSNY